MADKIKNAKLGDLKPDVHNANAHTERGTYMLNQSVGKFGSREAGTLDKNGFIVGGNNRHTAYGALGIDDIQIIKADPNKPVFLQYDDLDLTDDDNPARELSVALNRSAQVGINFDPEVLAEYQLAEVDLGDWFKDDELAELYADIEPENAGEDTEPQIDKAEELRQKWGVESGQMWQLGEHRIICGDCTDAAVVARVMGGEKAEMVQTDPIYGVDYSGQSDTMFYGKDKTGIKREKLDGDRTPYEAQTITTKALSFVKSPLLFLWCAPQFHDLAKESAIDNGYTIFSVIVWNKNHANFGAMGARYKPKYEMALACKIDTIPWFGADNETTVWDVDRASKNEYHPTQKPVELFERAIKNHTLYGGIVYDPFSGSGTTIIACENLNRRCRAIEIDPGYVAVAIERWADHTGKTPELVEAA